jgi:hypothetical protein
MLFAFVAAAALIGQIVSPGQAYTTADPVNPERIGLATVDGRYMAQVSDTGDCSSITTAMNVMVWQVTSDDGTRIDTAIKPLNDDGTLADQDYCFLVVYRLMDPTPCFLNDSGVCDVASE